MGNSNSRTISVIARSSGRTYCFYWGEMVDGWAARYGLRECPD